MVQQLLIFLWLEGQIKGQQWHLKAKKPIHLGKIPHLYSAGFEVH